jgi:hypothetical protein
MARRIYKAEEIMNLLRQVEVGMPMDATKSTFAIKRIANIV